MGLRDYLRVARRHWWVIAAALLLALSVAFVINLKSPRVYAAQVTFFFTTPGAGTADAFPASMFSQGRLNSYAALLGSDRITEALARTPGVNLTAQEVAERITGEAVPDTVMLRVTVEDRSRARAQLLAETLVERFEELVEELESPATVGVEVVAGPKLEEEPVAPRPLENYALAAMAGLILGASAAVGREVSDSSVRTADALQAIVQAPVLARVPVDGNAPTRSGPFVSDSNSPRAEALRQLRTNLQHAGAEGPVKTLAVTSAMPEEGRSATACNLALLFAESGLRVLIVDAEMRHPRLASFLGRENAAGLSTILIGAASVEQALQPWGAGLWLLTSGQSPPNPSELLSSPRMTELVDELRRRFDIVIFDCPPLLPVTDAALISARSDGALLVVRAQRTKDAQVAAAARSLRAVNARIIGCVLNMVAGKGDVFPGSERYSAAPPGETSHPQQAPAAARVRWWNVAIPAQPTAARTARGSLAAA